MKEPPTLKQSWDDLVEATRYWEFIGGIMNQLACFLIWSKQVWQILNGDARTEKLINAALSNYEIACCLGDTSLFKEASACVFGWDSNTKATAFADEEIELMR